MHVPDPYLAVPLHPVPEVVLEAKADGIGPGLPDPVEPLVAAAEGPLELQIPTDEDGPDVVQPGGRRAIEEVEPDEPEPRAPDFVGATRLDGADLLAEGFAHRLGDRLPEADPDPDGPARRGVAHPERDAAVDLAPEVQDDARGRTVIRQQEPVERSCLLVGRAGRGPISPRAGTGSRRFPRRVGSA